MNYSYILNFFHSENQGQSKQASERIKSVDKLNKTEVLPHMVYWLAIALKNLMTTVGWLKSL